VTLLECLIAIFVLAIGLVSVASLVPLASFQAQRALVDDRKATLGPAAYRDCRIRGFLRPDYWRFSSSPASPSGAAIVSQLNSTNPSASYSWTTGATQTIPCYAIDPLMVAAFGNANDFFDAANTNSPFTTANRMKRITIVAIPTQSLPTTPSTTPLGLAADQSCTSQDDKRYPADPNNPDALPTAYYFGSSGKDSNGNPITTNGPKRGFDGQFSWLATLVPVWGDPVATLGHNDMLMSVVVFNRRSFAQSPTNATNPTERAAKVTFNGATPTSLAGGDIIITDTNALNVNVNVGEWIMIGAMINDLNATATNKQRPMFRWYRVVTAGPVTGSYQRNITIAGPDWPLNQIVSGTNMMAYIYDGAVAVYERTVRLEGPSLWSN
jgi:hypothetical protein